MNRIKYYKDLIRQSPFVSTANLIYRISSVPSRISAVSSPGSDIVEASHLIIFLLAPPRSGATLLAQTCQKAYDVSYISNLDEIGMMSLSAYLQKSFNKSSYNKLESFRGCTSHPLGFNEGNWLFHRNSKLNIGLVNQLVESRRGSHLIVKNAQLSSSSQLWDLPSLFPSAKYIINFRDFDASLKSQRRIFETSGTLFPIHCKSPFTSNPTLKTLEANLINIYDDLHAFSSKVDSCIVNYESLKRHPQETLKYMSEKLALRSPDDSIVSEIRNRIY